ncbi:hypothetical protein D6C81_06598 [Aureobasidium pullulans]|nr:hypothetical protein D6C81_06598 [Aureobasidium pullulans]
MATHGQDSESNAPSDRPTVQSNSLLDTLPSNGRSTRGWLRNPTSSVHLALHQFLRTLTQIAFSSSYVRPTTTKTADARSFLLKSTLDFLPSKEHATLKAWMPCLTTSS